MVRAKILCFIAILVTAVCACAADAPDANEAQLDEPAMHAEIGITETVDQASSTRLAAELATPGTDDVLANCSVVTTCNAPGGDGTRCRQQPGCTVGAARLECALESIVVCGAAVCPVVLIKLNGTRENLCAQGDRE